MGTGYVLSSSVSVDGGAFEDCPRARARFAAQARARGFVKRRNKYKRPDFPRMILDLRTLGWSHSAIARIMSDIHCPSAVSGWANGTRRPNYDNGEELIMLWQDQTKILRVPREGEWVTYRYDIGQLELNDVLDSVIDQLDDELDKP